LNKGTIKMPSIAMGNIQSQRVLLQDKKYEYEYPDGLDLDPNSELHKLLVTRILERAIESHKVIQKRIPAWNTIDQVLTSYVSLSDNEKDIQYSDSRKPVSIVFPYSYAVLETILTYLVMAFLPDPIFRYEGVSSDDTIGAILMEKIVQLQCHRSKAALYLHTMFRDGLAYGIGAVAPDWKVRHGFKEAMVEEPMFSMLPESLANVLPKRKTRQRVETVLFEGNTLSNIDPYLFLPDPDVGVQASHAGEYRGWVSQENYLDLLSSEQHGDGGYFNVKYLKHLNNKQSAILAGDKSERTRAYGGPTLSRGVVTSPTDVINLYINIIPQDWKVGKSEYPEKWLFSLAADSVIIRARPLELNHDMFPVAVCAPEFDGYSPTPISRLEMLSGLQKVTDWMFNSHVANVRKAINDMLVVDPYLINIKDLQDPEPGGLIRMRRPAWGKGVKDAVMQLNVSDITRSNISDIMFMTQFMQKAGGADESMGGSLRQGGPERLTKGEFQGTRAGGVSRMEKLALIIGVQALQDLGYMFASHTQQFMQEETYVKIAGNWQNELMKEYGKGPNDRVKVKPTDLLIDYDLMMRDGSVPSGNFADSWIQLFNILATNPELQQRIDVFRVFTHIARDIGAKNVFDFERVKSTVQPNEMVEKEADKGNLVPFQEAVNAGIVR
jgi:hypothetical protein